MTILRNQRSLIAQPSRETSLAAWGRCSVVDAAGGLAMAREHPADDRPELCLWFVAQEDRYRQIAIEHAARRLLVRYRNADAEALAYAAIDAADVVRPRSRNSRPPTTAQRAKQVGVRKAAFAELRGAAVDSLRRAIFTGLERYVRACRDPEPATPGSRHSGSMQSAHTLSARPTPELPLAIFDLDLRSEAEQLTADFKLSNGVVVSVPIPSPVFRGAYKAGVSYLPLSIVLVRDGFGWVAADETTEVPGASDLWVAYDIPESEAESKALAQFFGDLAIRMIRLSFHRIREALASV